MQILTDSHAHLSCEELRTDLNLLLDRALKGGVGRIINIATRAHELEHALALQEQFPWVLPAGATTPHDVATYGEEEFSFFARHAREKRVVAIGETGLDYHYKYSDPAIQKNFLRRYAHLALETGLPLIIHCREAFSDLFTLLDAEYKNAPLVLHCFTGTLEEASEVISRGWYLSLSGIVTFKNSEALREVARRVPLDQLLIETDSPYLAPMPWRGKQNEPAFIIETAKCIATVCNLSQHDLAFATTQNAARLFGVN